MSPRRLAWKPTLAVVAFVVLSIVAYRAWLVPLVQEVVILDFEAHREQWRRKIEEEQRRRDLESEARSIRRETELRQRWVEETVPSALRTEETIATIRAWAERDTVDVLEASASPTEPYPPLVRSRLHLRLRGSYAAHTRLLRRLAAELPLATIDALALEPAAGDPPPGREGEAPEPPLVLDLRLSLYADPEGRP